MNDSLILRSLPFLLAAVLLAGCQQERGDAPSEPTEPPLFRDVTDEWGLVFHHDAGATGAYFMPQILGSGAALFDYDNDGRLDIYLLHNAGPQSASTNRLFHQEKDGRFREVAGSGLNIAGYGMGAAVGDINNDGWPDVLVTHYGGSRLFLNNGNGTFTEVSRDAELDTVLWGTSACFLDYDRDGWLDLVVTNYVDYGPNRPCFDSTGKRDYCAPYIFAGSVTKLYHNRGRPPAGSPARVRFEDVTVRSGLGTRSGPGLGVVSADFDGDGWPDIFIANDVKQNHLWINQKNGTFREEALTRGLALNCQGQMLGNMGIALADVDGDLRFDIFIPHLSEEPPGLWRQESTGYFQDVAAKSGLAVSFQRGTGFGTVLADFDRDGAPDLAVVNGRVLRHHGGRRLVNSCEGRDDFWLPFMERNQLFINDGKGRFRNVCSFNPDFCGRVGIYRGLACGDIDGDGAVDLLVTDVAGPARLFKNVAPKKGHWLMARVLDPALHRDAYGAEVIVTAAGGRRWKGWVNPGYSFLCSNDPRVHFGLGSAASVERFDVQWPDGVRETFTGCAADQAVELRRGTAKPVPQKRGKP